MILRTRVKSFDLSTGPLLMGVLNVTPDSFSDGGKFFSPEKALAQAEKLIADGADILDVGGESTRPGADPVSAAEEGRRVIPVIEAVVKRFPQTPVSIDTAKSEVARRALESGAALVNDISALRFDADMASVVRPFDAPVILMHMQGTPRTMQGNPSYRNVVGDIRDFFRERVRFAVTAGLRQDRLLLDPGIGFGKTLEHNLEILRQLRSFSELGCPLVIGTSLKSFIGRLLATGDEPAPPAERGEGTVASCLWAAAQGAHVLRVHDVAAVRRALAVWNAIANPPNG